jgi:hypothetical protein
MSPDMVTLSGDKPWSLRGRLAHWAGAHACSGPTCTQRSHSSAGEHDSAALLELGQWKLCRELIRALARLLVASHLLICWGGGRGKRAFQMKA